MPTATIRIAGALFAASIFAINSSAQPVVARAASVTGRALLTQAGSGPAFNLTPGFTLSFADRVDTRPGGRVVIELSDGSVVIVQPGTLLTIKNFSAAESLRELFEIAVGVVRVKINHFAGKPNPYRMNSPTASIAVRGTEFAVTVSEQGETSVEVFEGAVEVSSLSDPARSVLVEGGHGVLVPAGAEFRLYTLQGSPIARGDRMDEDRRGPPGFEQHPGRGGPPPPPQNQASMTPHPSPPQASSPVPDLPGGPGGHRPEHGFEARAAVSKPVEGAPPLSQHPGVPGDGDHHGHGFDARAAASRPAEEPAENLQGHSPSPKDVEGSEPPQSTTQASLYQRYLGSLAGVGDLPFSNRFIASADPFSDVLENPAYAAAFRHQMQGRLSIAPIWGGLQTLLPTASGAASPLAAFTLSPQASFYSPALNGRLVAGGSVSLYNMGTPEVGFPAVNGASTSRLMTASSTLAVRLTGADNIGFGFERFAGAGYDGLTASSSVSQNRWTLGYSRDLPHHQTLGVFYRRGWIDAGSTQASAAGASNEFGARLRGSLNRRLWYGVSANWNMIRLNTDRDLRIARTLASVGLGWLIDRKTVASFDVSLSKSRTDSLSLDRAFSAHVSVERNLTSKLFASASYLGMARQSAGLTSLLGAVSLYPNGGRFSDFGIGWRFKPQLTVQYIHSTDYRVTSGMNALVLRYTFRGSGE